MRRAAIVRPVRTPVGASSGALRDVPGLETMCIGGDQGTRRFLNALDRAGRWSSQR